MGTICRPHPAPGQPFWADAATSSCPEWAARTGGAARGCGGVCTIQTIQTMADLNCPSHRFWSVAAPTVYLFRSPSLTHTDPPVCSDWGEPVAGEARSEGHRCGQAQPNVHILCSQGWQCRIAAWLWSGLVRFEHLPKSQSLSSFCTLQFWDVPQSPIFEKHIKVGIFHPQFCALLYEWYYMWYHSVQGSRWGASSFFSTVAW